MTDMNLMDHRRAAEEPAAVIALGLRAGWLHLTLTGPRSAGLTSRDRDVLTFVATSAYGVSELAITANLRRGGVKWPTASASIQRLVAEESLSRRGIGPGTFVVDLPGEDLAWIVANTVRVMACAARDGGGS